MKKLVIYFFALILGLVLANIVIAQEGLLPDLTVTLINAPTLASTQEQITVSWTVKNQGEGQVAPGLGEYGQGWHTAIYFSTDTQLDGADTYITYDRRVEAFAPGGTYTVTKSISIPAVPAGNYYFLGVADAFSNNVHESNEENNVFAQPITIKAPDLAIASIQAPTSASTQEQITVSWTVKNQGEGQAAQGLGEYGQGWHTAIYFSTDTQLDGSDTYITYDRRVEPFAPGETYTVTQNINIPAVPAGNYYFLGVADAFSNNVCESNEENNVFAQPITIKAPDLVIASIQAPTSASTQEQIIVSWTVKNQGEGKAQAQEWFDVGDQLYLSTDNILDSSDTEIGSAWRPEVAAGASYTATTTVQVPNVSQGNYYLLVRTDPSNYVYETREWNNVLARLITIEEEGVLSEKFSQESTFITELLSQKAILSDGTVAGDLTGTINFSSFEIVSINTGPFAGKGFSQGNWQVTLEGVTYQGEWQGISFLLPSERKLYLKGTVSGGEAQGIVEGYLTEAIPESGVYDQYHATWRLGHLGDKAVSVTLNLEGALSYAASQQYPSTQMRFLQISLEGTTIGHYIENISTVLTHLEVTSQDSPYFGDGFSIISYSSKTGSGDGWTFDKLISPGKIELNGMFTSPLLGIVSGSLDGAASARTVSLSIERIDLALSPAPELMVKVWGPKRVSPGQTISYIIEYRNDGLMGANEAIVSIELPTLSDYLLGSKGAFYNELAGTVSWDLGLLPAKAIGYLTVQVSFPWGLPQGLEFNIPAYITLIEHHSTEDNLSLNGFQLKTKQIAPGKDNPDVIKYKTLTKLFDAKWLPVYTDLDFFEATPHALAAMLGIPTDKNGLVENQGNRPKVLTYSGSTISGVALIEKGLVTTKEFQAASTVLTYQDRLQKLSEKGVEKVVVYYSLNDDVIPKPIRLRYSANQESEFKIVVSDIEFPYQSQELSLKVKRMIEIGEEIFSKNFNKTLKVKTLNIFSDKVGNQVELEMVDEQGNIFPLLLPDGTLLPKPFYIQNDMKTGQPIKSEGIIQVEEVVGVFHPGWSDYLILKFRLLKIGQKISEVWKNVASFFKTLIVAANDPNELSVSPVDDVKPGDTLTYTIQYENEGEGIAYGVYFTDTLEEDLDDSNLTIGPILDSATGEQIGGFGIYNPATRTITWFVGEVASKQGGSANFSVKVKNTTPNGSEVINYATVYFPSVPEATRTNGTVNKVTSSVDNVPPTTTASISPEANEADWNKSDVTISLSAVDNEEGSGIAKIEYSLDSTNWITYATSFTITREGTTIVYYKSTDNTGNVEPQKSLEINLDKTPPTITTTISPPPNSSGWHNTDVIVTFTATDNLSGINSFTEPTTVTTEGKNQHIGGEAVDLADNRATTFVTLNIDKIPPQVNISATPNTLWPPNHKLVNVTISGGATDNLSGIASNVFKVTDEYKTIEPVIPNFNSIIQLEAWRNGNDLEGRIYTISVTTKDKADNQTTNSTTVTCSHDQGKK